MYYAYVIESLADASYHYKGHCADLEKRLQEHNQGKTTSNKAYAPFKVVYSEAFNLREEAIKKEKYLKTAEGRRFLKKVLQ